MAGSKVSVIKPHKETTRFQAWARGTHVYLTLNTYERNKLT